MLLTSVPTGILEDATAILETGADHLYSRGLAWLLIAIGIYFTIATRGLQIRLFGQMVKAITASRAGAEGGISSFQAFAVGLASRVGTGNIIGVALAIKLGGPGAVFWMWVVATIGMATGFIESTLAQMFKVTSHDGTFRGGPAYYIQRGLGSRAWAVVFAVIITFVFGFAYEAIQANAIAGTLKGTFNISEWHTAVALVLITLPVVFRGIRRVARVTEWMAPLMALVYVILAITVLLLNLSAIPEAFTMIIKGAFGLDQALYGTAGGFFAAAINGIKRGLFSNEAGEGSVPNAAATATVAHPVQQGFIQSFGVFVDTIVVCTSTALIILLSGFYSPQQAERIDPNVLTSQSISEVMGGWTQTLMAIIILVFAYSSLLGNYTYAEVNVDFLCGGAKRWAHIMLRSVILIAAFIGAVASLDFVWNLADIGMGFMAIINIVAIALLGKWALGALRDWEVQDAALRAGEISEIRFIATDNPHLPGALPDDMWAADGAAHAGSAARRAALEETAGGSPGNP
ncbi:sodium:alanine symporter family protein [Actinomyces slackii]|uniref:Na+/alanine symporter n=1 Tax=Actinomyces slackii TaxID=52774 RepID=A0A448KD29_9ACTO|nr:alanine/glycine:cation symporter family protein [Actinomyces slackii]VEG74839.1 Na+/alanine symporter [Actinomyces slackii]